ncbi:MAG: DUF1902 domain-containing protein [Gammaproteobacteria bacterium]|nr:DUF1902 domain-containing protein [Gammaproteobacteria bacterium]
MNPILVKAVWDGEAGVWVATSDNVPGLATEAATISELEARLEVVIPELLRENGIHTWEGAEVPLELLASKNLDLTKAC